MKKKKTPVKKHLSKEYANGDKLTPFEKELDKHFKDATTRKEIYEIWYHLSPQMGHATDEDLKLYQARNRAIKRIENSGSKLEKRVY